MQINLSELFTTEGKEKTYTPDIEMDIFCAPDGVYDIIAKKPVNLRIRNLGGRNLLLEGHAEFSLAIPCGRCLMPVSYEFDLELVRELDMNQSEEERIKALDEQPYIEGYLLDVDQLVRNELLLNLPMKVLCEKDCKGICNRCGMNLNLGSCDCDTFSPDPRMSVVQDIFKQFKEV